MSFKIAIIGGWFILVGLFLWVFMIDILPAKSAVVGKRIYKLQPTTKWLDFLFKEKISNKQMPKFEMSIPVVDLNELFSQLPTPYSDNLQKTKYTNMEISFNGNTYTGETRIHGDLYQHWSTNKKSWRVRIKDGEFEGNKEVSFVVPDDRQFFSEVLASYRAQKLGIPHLFNAYGRLSINGIDQGLYFIQGNFDDVFLEQNGFSDKGIIFSDRNPSEPQGWQDLYSGIGLWKAYQKSNKGMIDYSALDELLRLVEKADDQEFAEKIGKVIDLKSFAKWHLLQLLMNSYHQDGQHNNVLVKDEQRRNLTMISYDAQILPFGMGFSDYHPLMIRIMKFDQYVNMLTGEACSYLENGDEGKDDLSYYDQLVKDYGAEITHDENKNHSNLYFREVIKNRRSDLERQFNWLKDKYENKCKV